MWRRAVANAVLRLKPRLPARARVDTVVMLRASDVVGVVAIVARR